MTADERELLLSLTATVLYLIEQVKKVPMVPNSVRKELVIHNGVIQEIREKVRYAEPR